MQTSAKCDIRFVDWVCTHIDEAVFVPAKRQLSIFRSQQKSKQFQCKMQPIYFRKCLNISEKKLIKRSCMCFVCVSSYCSSCFTKHRTNNFAYFFAVLFCLNRLIDLTQYDVLLYQRSSALPNKYGIIESSIVIWFVLISFGYCMRFNASGIS